MEPVDVLQGGQLDVVEALPRAAAADQLGLVGTDQGRDDVELATLEWVDWHNNRRLHTACHDLTPVEYGQVFYGQHPAQQTVGVSQPEFPDSPGRFSTVRTTARTTGRFDCAAVRSAHPRQATWNWLRKSCRRPVPVRRW
ncbi:IS3 family transposase [Geodermatophilus sp. URMC 65]